MAGDEGFEFARGQFLPTDTNRITSVKRAAEARTRQWILGAVAVSVAVKFPLNYDVEDAP